MHQIRIKYINTGKIISGMFHLLFIFIVLHFCAMETDRPMPFFFGRTYLLGLLAMIKCSPPGGGL